MDHILRPCQITENLTFIEGKTEITISPIPLGTSLRIYVYISSDKGHFEHELINDDEDMTTEYVIFESGFKFKVVLSRRLEESEAKVTIFRQDKIILEKIFKYLSTIN